MDKVESRGLGILAMSASSSFMSSCVAGALMRQYGEYVVAKAELDISRRRAEQSKVEVVE